MVTIFGIKVTFSGMIGDRIRMKHLFKVTKFGGYGDRIRTFWVTLFGSDSLMVTIFGDKKINKKKKINER